MLTLSAFKRPIVYLWLLVIFQPFPLVLHIRVVALSSFALPSHCFILGWILMVASFSASSLSWPKLFVFALVIVLTAILIVIYFWMISILRLISLSPLSSLVISILFLIGLLIVGALIPVILPVRALRPSVGFLMLVVLWIFGRYLHPTSSAFTWTRWDGNLASRIDLVDIPYVWVPSIESCDILSCPFSDHCGVLSSISVPDVVPPGPGLWKLNVSILQDDHVQLITNSWVQWRASMHRFPSLAKWWEEDKSLIKGLTIRYCCSKSAVHSRNRDLLVCLIDHLKAKVDARSVSCLGPYHSALSDLVNLDSQAAKGVQVHSWVKWVEEGETSSAYFFSVWKKRLADRWISALRDDNGTIVSFPNDLCCVLSNFYLCLFSAVPTDLSVRLASLDGDQAALCEGLLAVEECFAALKGMARSKAPGSDGLPMEFYLKFWHVLCADLVAVLNSCFVSGSLSLSQCRGVIFLTFKKGDRLNRHNWRPITLLNVDYKISSRVIAGFLLKVINHVVDKDQTCGVPGWFIGENVLLLCDLVDFATFSDTPAAVLSLDQEKALTM